MNLRMSWLDWKLGGRMLVKYPGLTVFGGLTLAVAIGLGAAWFEVTRQILDPRLPLEEGERIVRIDMFDAAESEAEPRALYDLQIWHEQLTSITDLGAYRSYQRNLITPDGDARPTNVAEISPSAFPLTRVQPLLGRSLVPEDAAPGAADVVVIGYDVWRSRFDGDRTVMGRTVRIGRTAATIVGVMPEGFRFPVSQNVWVPLRLPNVAPREGPGVSIFGRLAPGASLESAQAELSAIGQRVATLNPATHAQLRPLVFRYAAPQNDETTLVRLTNIIAWLILVVACANVATLMFARTAARESEIAVRSALGASRARVMMQLLVEALVLCAVAAIAGLLAASFGLDYGVRIASREIGQLPFWWQFGISPMTVIYTALLAAGGAVLVGLLPAIRATSQHVQSALTKLTGGGSNMRFGGVWSVMIVLQVAFAAVCLPIGFAAVFFTLHDMPSRDLYPIHEYLTFRPELDRDVSLDATAASGDAAAQRASLVDVYEELKRRLQSESAVSAVSFASGLPGAYFQLRQVEAQRGEEAPFLVDASIEGDRVKTAAVDIAFFDLFRMPLVAGRAFNAGDVQAANAVIINETLARNIGGNPIGVRIRYIARADLPTSAWYEIVGVVRNHALDAADFAFVPVSAADVSPLVVAVHLRGDAAAFAPRLRTIAAQVEPGLRLHDLMSLEGVLQRSKLPEIQGMYATMALVLIIMALSVASLYSLMSVAVTRRTREIGIRLAIGASPRAVLRAVFARAALLVGIGISLAVVLIPPLMSALGFSELRVNEVAPAMLITSGGMLLVALLACGVPARRALRIQATEAMKYVG